MDDYVTHAYLRMCPIITCPRYPASHLTRQPQGIGSRVSLHVYHNDTSGPFIFPPFMFPRCVLQGVSFLFLSSRTVFLFLFLSRSLSLLISSLLLHFLLRVFAVRCSSPDLYILFIHTFLSSSTCAFIAALLYTLFTAFRNYHQHHHHIAGNEPTHQITRPAQNKNYTKKQ
jgi:hypothetical protein